MIMSPKEFSIKVTALADSNHISPLDALIHVCEEDGIDFEYVAPMITPQLKELLAEDFRGLRMLPKVATLEM